MEEQPCEIGEFRTEFEKLFHICGMSLSSASDMLCVRRSNVCAWNSGKKVPPEGVLNGVKFLSYNMKIQEFKTDLGPEQFIIAFILDLKKIADTL
jgi:hypothetical protein